MHTLYPYISVVPKVGKTNVFTRGSIKTPDTLGICRSTLANAFAGGLMSIPDDDHATVLQKLQAKKTQTALNSSEAFQRMVPLVTEPRRKEQIMTIMQTMRKIIIRNMRRQVPISTRLPPALQLKSMKHRALACRWHLGVFLCTIATCPVSAYTCTWMT